MPCGVGKGTGRQNIEPTILGEISYRGLLYKMRDAGFPRIATGKSLVND